MCVSWGSGGGRGGGVRRVELCIVFTVTLETIQTAIDAIIHMLLVCESVMSE